MMAGASLDVWLLWSLRVAMEMGVAAAAAASNWLFDDDV
jgi:hypothetical protein